MENAGEQALRERLHKAENQCSVRTKASLSLSTGN
jgi:hypothetical protein